MNLKKILKLLIFFVFFMSIVVCPCCFANNDISAQQKQLKEKINRARWLESVENNKLYKNQQKLEDANNNLNSSKAKIATAQSELNGLEGQLSKAYSEYNGLNTILSNHILSIYKTQRKAFFEMLLSSEDINSFVDTIHYQSIIINEDYRRMDKAKSKAQEIARLKYNIESRKRNLERSVASINNQQAYIKRAIKRNEDMIDKLKRDKATYQKAERELERQSQSLGTYINKTAKDQNNYTASGFSKPIQGRITSPFGWRTHPIFNTKSFHSGIDIGGPNLGAIRASNSGKVIYSGWYGGYGKVVIIEHGVVNGKPITTLYAHMSSTKAVKDQRVAKGDIIGYEGTTGYSTGPHCHFEVRVNGQPNNPVNYIK